MIRPFKDRLDVGDMTLTAAVELSYLSEDEQETAAAQDVKVDEKTAKAVRAADSTEYTGTWQVADERKKMVRCRMKRNPLNGGQDPYPENEFDRKYKTKNESDSQNSGNDRNPVGVVLTDDEMAGKSVTTSVKKTKLKEWYSESKALACMVDTDCFAYVEL